MFKAVLTHKSLNDFGDGLMSAISYDPIHAESLLLQEMEKKYGTYRPTDSNHTRFDTDSLCKEGSSLRKLRVDGAPYTKTGVSKPPVVAQWHRQLKYFAVSPNGLVVDEVNSCLLCSVKVHYQIDRKCSCSDTKNIHYGCILQYVRTLGNQCPYCLQPISIPVAKLISECDNTYLTGCSFKNVHNAVSSMIVDEIALNLPGRFFSRFVQWNKSVYGYGKVLIECPQWLSEDVFNMTMNGAAKAGLYFGPEGFDNKPSKRIAYQSTKEWLHLYVKDLYFIYSSKGTITDDDLLQVIGDSYAKLSFKIEVLQDPEKQRIFFITSLLKFLIDKVLLSPIFKSLYNFKNIMIGFRWADGGAQRLHDWLFKGGDRFYFEWDLRRMDQKVKWAHILFNLWTLYQDYGLPSKPDLSFNPNEDDSFNVRSFELLLTSLLTQWTARNSAFTKTKWFEPKSWRIVIGILFSGEFITSVSQTMTSIFAFVTWLFFIRELMELYPDVPDVVKEAIEIELRDLRAKMYGDDGICSLPNILAPYCSLHANSRDESDIDVDHDDRFITFADFLTRFHGLEIKISESHEYSDLLTEVFCDHSEIVKRGPKILQRHFIEDSGKIISFRPSRLWKLVVPSQETISWEMAVMRLVGHMWDTHGNNKHQILIIRNLVEKIIDIHSLDDSPSMQRQFKAKMEELYGVDPRVTRHFDALMEKHYGLTSAEEKASNVLKMFKLPTTALLRYEFNTFRNTFSPTTRTLMPWRCVQALELGITVPIKFGVPGREVDQYSI